MMAGSDEYFQSQAYTWWNDLDDGYQAEIVVRAYANSNQCACNEQSDAGTSSTVWLNNKEAVDVCDFCEGIVGEIYEPKVANMV